MPLRRQPQESRGPGARRFNHLRHQRPPERLESDKHMLYEHALRCLCNLCGGLLNWECPDGISYTETECCGLRYRLQPWTVKVNVEDVSSRPLLPKMAGSDYANPEFDLTDQLIGEQLSETFLAKSLSQAQQDLRRLKSEED